MDRLLALAAAAERQTGRFEDGIAPRAAGDPDLAPLPVPGRGVARRSWRPGPVRVAGRSRAGRAAVVAAAGQRARRFAVGPGRAGASCAPNLRAQVQRLLRDPRSDRFVSRFVGQWLQTRDVDTVNIAGDGGRALTPALRRLMRAETEMLFAHVMREDRDVMELVTADYSFLNGTLARHYGIAGVEGPALRRVTLPAGSHARRRADPRQRPGRHLEPHPHLAGQARPVRAGQPAGRAAAAAAAQRPQPGRRGKKGERAQERCASNWSSTGETRAAPAATCAWIRWAWRWSASTAIGRWRERYGQRGRDRRTPRSRCRPVSRSPVWTGCGRCWWPAASRSTGR